MFRAFSAGSRPAGRIHRGALHQLEVAGLPIEELRSKSWDEFGAPGAPKMDFIFTLCDNAAQETCPVWPGQPVKAHWGLPDPGSIAVAAGDEERAFRDAFVTLDRRIGLFLRLPLASLTDVALQKELDGIGRA